MVLITGATSGLGLAAAGGFARLGARVWLAVRNRDRGEAARARILEHQGDADVYVESCDLSRCEAVRGFAERFTGEAQRLDVLVNNAGVLTQTRELSADGIELTLATNVIGPFLSPGCWSDCSSAAPRPGSPTCPRAACTRRSSESTICRASRETSTGRRCTRGPSALRWF